MDDRTTIEEYLATLEENTKDVEKNPYSIDRYKSRAFVYDRLGFPDLAVMDTYKALLLIDEVADEDAEYHDRALAAVKQDLEEDDSVKCVQYVESHKTILLVSMANYLTQIGCLRHAYDYAQQALKNAPSDSEAKRALSAIENSLGRDNAAGDVEITRNDLPETGRVRREIYPWNKHEAQRNSEEAVQLLNTQMQKIAPKLEVRVTQLPALHSTANSTSKPPENTTTTQLGVFALADIQPGEEILKERSLLTGNSRLHEPLCDACSAPLPTLDNTSTPLASCANCPDTIFCSETCHDLAQAQYHPAICDTDIDTLAKDVPPAKAADTLYMLLLFRTLAMAETQATHPLDLPEVKYIWGDFTPRTPPTCPLSQAVFADSPRSLPFSFAENILTPLHMLELMDVDIFAAEHDMAEVWVWNTLYAKFRGTASARISPRDGRPEVAAVHPLWCLANHSCDPNVGWEWAGQVRFDARAERVAWRRMDADGGVVEERAGRRGGIGKDEEVLNHYVDVGLPVKERREWGVGALGGLCMCERCVWESAVDA